MVTLNLMSVVDTSSDISDTIQIIGTAIVVVLL
jgi:hypothetical protein